VEGLHAQSPSKAGAAAGPPATSQLGNSRETFSCLTGNHHLA
jgi:hypothetical protein